MQKIYLCCTLLFLSIYTYSQNTTTAAATPTQAVQTLLGPNGTPLNVQFSGNLNQIATFTSTGTNLPLSSGVIISTGIANNPDLNGDVDNFLSDPVNGLYSNPLLNNISGDITEDGAILQFKFVPMGDTMTFNYVFASEEYNDFVDAGVNDAFGFFLSGPNPLGGNYTDFNIALIPGTSQSVSIDNVNNGSAGWFDGCVNGPCDNCQYYIDNLCVSNSTIAPDGFTVKLTAIAAVVPCSTYTIKLGIADSGDDIYDSWVFLEESSFNTGAVSVEPTYNYSSSVNDTLIHEGCSDVTLKFTRSGVIGLADTIDVVITGTAINGTDYQVAGGSFPTQIPFLPGESFKEITLTPVADALAEASESAIFTVTNVTLCGDTVVSQVTFIITDVQPMHVDAGPDFNICSGISITATPVVTGGITPYTQTHWALNTQSNVFATALSNYVPTVSGNYIYSAANGCNPGEVIYDTIAVNIISPQFTLQADADSVSCFASSPDGSIDLSVIGQTPPFTYNWTPGNISTQDLSNLGAGIYTVAVTDNGGCVVRDTIQIFAPTNISFDIANQFVCSNDSLLINPNPLPGVSYTWSPAPYFTTPTSPSPVFFSNNLAPLGETIPVTVMASSAGACGRDTFSIFVTPYTPTTLVLPGLDSLPLCPNDSIFLENVANTSAYPNITHYLWNTGAAADNITATSVGTYWLEVTNTTGCKSRDSLKIYPVSPPNALTDSVHYVCGDESVTLFATSYSPTDDLLWSTGQTSDSISVNTPGIYSLYITNDCGTDTVTTEVISIPLVESEDMPNVFTPNGDGVNDVYTLDDDIFFYSNIFNVQIFNRWGAKVFETEDKSIGWKPKNLSDGVYFIAIIYTDCHNEHQKMAQTITLVSKN